MRFSAIATPMETPTPVPPLAPIAAEAATTVASIFDALLDSTSTFPDETTVLLFINAFVFDRTRFLEFAPAPLTLIPVPPPNEAAKDAAMLFVVMEPSEILHRFVLE